jgi:hypothetical protein
MDETLYIFLKTVETFQNFSIKKSSAKDMKFEHLIWQSLFLFTLAVCITISIEHISPIINIKDDDTKILKYPVPNRKEKSRKSTCLKTSSHVMDHRQWQA